VVVWACLREQCWGINGAQGRLGTEGRGEFENGPQMEYQDGITDGQKDWCNRGVFLYSNQRSTVGEGTAVGCELERDGAVGCQPKGQ